MRKAFTTVGLLAVLTSYPSTTESGQGRPVPPGIREADRLSNAPLESPVWLQPKASDSATLKREADELARLSAAVPANIELTTRGQLPRELGDQLKRIEKLAKHLRSQISQ